MHIYITLFLFFSSHLVAMSEGSQLHRKRRSLTVTQQVEKKQRDENKEKADNLLSLHSSCRNDENIETTRTHLRQGANPNLDQNGFPLHIAIDHLAVETARVLLAHGADVALPIPCFRQTPLHLVCTLKSQDPDRTAKKMTLAKMLLYARAPLHVKGFFDRTPFEWAFSKSEDPCFAALAKLLHSEARYRLVVEIESTQKKNRKSNFNRIPKDVIKMIILEVYPRLSKTT